MIIVGLDVAQRVDSSAIVVVETAQRETGVVRHDERHHRDNKLAGCRPAPYCMDETEDVFLVRDWGRLPIGTEYPEVSRRVVSVITALNDAGHVPRLLIDATGVGLPVADDVAERVRGAARCHITAVTFTGGGAFRGGWGRRITVPKMWMVSRLIMLIENVRIRLPNTREATAIIGELKDFRMAQTDAGNLTAEARTGAHDDYVTALGLACLVDPTSRVIARAKVPWLRAWNGRSTLVCWMACRT